MKSVVVHQPGLETLAVEESPRPTLEVGGALVRVKATGLNPSDLLNVQGKFPQTILPRIPGRDFSGIVEEGPAEWRGVAVWGSGAELGFAQNGTHAEYVAVPAGSLVRKPESLSFAQAAAAGVPMVAAYLSLVTAARLQSGETAVITGASGAVGRLASQIALWLGARVIGVVRKLEPLPVSSLVLSSDDVVAKVKEATGGRGADVCLDAVGGPLFAAALGCLAEGGRLAVIVAKGDGNVTINLRDFYHHRLQLIGVDTLKSSIVETSQIYRALADPFETGAIKIEAPREVPLSDALTAYRELESGGGPKTVLIP